MCIRDRHIIMYISNSIPEDLQLSIICHDIHNDITFVIIIIQLLAKD